MQQGVTLKGRIRNVVTFFAIMVSAGCAAPFSDLQNARIVPKGDVQVTPSFSATTFSDEGETKHVQNVYGMQAAFGVNEVAEVRVGFARVDWKNNGGVNVIGLGPKVCLVHDHVAAYIPVGLSFEDGVKTSETWEAHPTVIFTTQPNRVVEINPSVKLLLPLSGGANDPVARDPRVALNLGFGISNNVDVWALRPEIGVMFNPGDEGVFAAYSLGVSVCPGGRDGGDE